jgi:hypothetical protein
MNRLNVRILALSWLLIIGISHSTSGWNKPTHMAIGAIAYRDLQASSPQLADKVVAILRQHPHFQSRWATQLATPDLSEDERKEYLFMLAARWPDDIRGNDGYHDHPTWHFINYVYAPQQGVIRSDTTLATGETILQAFEQNRQILRSNAPDSAKAVALCWLFHLAGDVHMPLHTAALVDTQFPQGDRGGNLFKIKVAMSSQTINLHSFWDGMLLGVDDYRSVDSMAVQLRHELARNQLPQLGRASGIVDWSKESFQLAQDNAYRSNTLQPGTDQDGAVLPADYVATVKPIAQRQVALSGYRLADELMADLGK